MLSASEKDGIFWSLVSWGGGIVAFLVVYVIARSLLGGTAPDGLTFGAVAFMVVAGILTFRLGPRDTATAHVAPAHHGAAEAVHHDVPAHDMALHEPAARKSAVHEPAAPAPVETIVPVTVAPAAAPAEASGVDLTGTRSERVSEAAREAARLAADLDAPVASPKRPPRMEAPREDGADNLKKIKGIGPKIEELLHKLGYYHFDQIAAWTPEEIAWVDTNIEDFPGRATRDDWVGQAKVLLSGGATEFSQRVDRGEVY